MEIEKILPVHLDPGRDQIWPSWQFFSKLKFDLDIYKLKPFGHLDFYKLRPFGHLDFYNLKPFGHLDFYNLKPFGHLDFYKVKHSVGNHKE